MGRARAPFGWWGVAGASSTLLASAGRRTGKSSPWWSLSPPPQHWRTPTGSSWCPSPSKGRGGARRGARCRDLRLGCIQIELERKEREDEEASGDGGGDGRGSGSDDGGYRGGSGTASGVVTIRRGDPRGAAVDRRAHPVPGLRARRAGLRRSARLGGTHPPRGPERAGGDLLWHLL